MSNLIYNAKFLFVFCITRVILSITFFISVPFLFIIFVLDKNGKVFEHCISFIINVSGAILLAICPVSIKKARKIVDWIISNNIYFVIGPDSSSGYYFSSDYRDLSITKIYLIKYLRIDHPCIIPVEVSELYNVDEVEVCSSSVFQEMSEELNHFLSSRSKDITSAQKTKIAAVLY